MARWHYIEWLTGEEGGTDGRRRVRVPRRGGLEHLGEGCKSTQAEPSEGLGLVLPGRRAAVCHAN